MSRKPRLYLTLHEGKFLSCTKDAGKVNSTHRREYTVAELESLSKGGTKVELHPFGGFTNTNAKGQPDFYTKLIGK